jgi:glycosyltransferase involved in cell wall biosynthesis
VAAERVEVALHAGQLLQPVPGGIGRYVEALLQELPTQSIDVRAFGTGSRPDGISEQGSWTDIGAPRLGARYELWHRFRRPRVDVAGQVLHAPSLAVPPRDQRPLVVTVHDVAFLRHPHSTTRRGVAFHERGLALARRDAELVLTPSEFTRQELLREGFDARFVRLARLGCDPAPHVADQIVNARVAATGVSGRFIVTVGTVEPRKRLWVLVEAFRSLRRKHPDLQLVIVGPDGWGSVGRLEYPGIHRLGRLPWSQVDALYRRAQLCCITSVYEGFGLPAAEAMARACPVVVTRGNALAEVVGGAGILVAPDDPADTATAIANVLDDAALRSDLARRGRERVATMGWDVTAREHAQIYRELTRKPPNSPGGPEPVAD